MLPACPPSLPQLAPQLRAPWYDGVGGSVSNTALAGRGCVCVCGRVWESVWECVFDRLCVSSVDCVLCKWVWLGGKGEGGAL